MTGDRHSLFLDYYPPILHPETGKETRREFLKLYLIDKPKNPFDKQHNKETQLLAENIRAKRQLELQAGNYGFLKKSTPKDFLKFFKDLADKHKAEGRGDKNNWTSVYNYFYKFTGGKCSFEDLSIEQCNEFREYLQSTETFRATKKKLTNNSAKGYFTIFGTVLKKAFEAKFISENLASRMQRISKEETQREFLTEDELNKMARAECDLPELKNAALFSALTGLRYSDIEKLLWKEIVEDKAEYSIRFTQKKTKGVETLPISEQAFSLLGERGKPEERVFKTLLYSSWQNMKLLQWAIKAGITKTITFHCFRHTFATLQLSNGTDIYTVSKMLGHKDLHTTQVYAKIVDQSKRVAANKIKLEI